MQEVYDFLKKANNYYLATVEGDQPRVRPFGTAMLFEGKLYIQTGRVKAVSKQMAANSKIEICAFMDGKWIRIAATAVDDDRVEVNRQLLEEYPQLKDRYTEDDGNCQCLYLKDATATFYSRVDEPRVIKF